MSTLLIRVWDVRWYRWTLSVKDVEQPLETAEARTQEHEVVFLENFFDELRRRASGQIASAGGLLVAGSRE
jgi:hypothetical protein